MFWLSPEKSTNSDNYFDYGNEKKRKKRECLRLMV